MLKNIKVMYKICNSNIVIMLLMHNVNLFKFNIVKYTNLQLNVNNVIMVIT